jgi:hypothetical protein
MKNIVLFRLTGDDAVWLADLDAGTVERADASAVDAAGGAQQIQGIDFALAAQSRQSAASHQFFPSR